MLKVEFNYPHEFIQELKKDVDGNELINEDEFILEALEKAIEEFIDENPDLDEIRSNDLWERASIAANMKINIAKAGAILKICGVTKRQRADGRYYYNIGPLRDEKTVDNEEIKRDLRFASRKRRNINRNILRITQARYTSNASPNIKHVFILATYSVAGQMVELKHFCGDYWGFRDKISDETLERAKKINARLIEAGNALNLDVRAGHLVPADQERR